MTRSLISILCFNKLSILVGLLYRGHAAGVISSVSAIQYVVLTAYTALFFLLCGV